jgi:hypothetical protein
MFKKTKTTILFAVLLLGVFMVPGISTVNAQGGFNFDFSSMTGSEIAEVPAGIGAGIASMFRMFDGLGPSGAALGEVFGLLFMNLMNFSIHDDLVDGVYTLNVSQTITESWEEYYQDDEIYWIWEQEYDDGITGEYPYVRIQRSGSANVTYTSGAAVVFIIWDNDGSLIAAIDKIVDAFHAVRNALESSGDPNGWDDETRNEVISIVVNEVLEAAAFLLFHINDIIKGDELIVSNIITWESYNLETSADYTVSKTYNEWDDWNLGDDDPINGVTLSNWLNEANARDDDYMKWLLSPGGLVGSEIKQWSRFSFDLIELWLKNFEIHINASAIVSALTDMMALQDPFSGLGLADIFQGMDIELYVMTHSLKGLIAYNDTNLDNVPSVDYTTIEEGGVSSEIITDSEAEFYFALGTIGSITFNEPVLTSDSKGIKWGIMLDNVQLSAVPIGMSPDDVATPINENIDYISMGFTFTPKLKEIVSTDGYVTLESDISDAQLANGTVKLDQAIGIWNGAGVVNNPDLAGLDIAVVFISTIVYFHFNIDVQQYDPLSEDPTAGLANSSQYQADGTIKIGNAAGDLPVAAVDICGPSYAQSPDGLTYVTHPAYSTTIPMGFLDFNLGASGTYVETANPSRNFQASLFLNVTASVLIYAVAYPTFDGSGDDLIHDPTFSVFMTWDNPGFWAVILVIGGVTLVAVAAIMITKRKNRV